MEIHSFRNFISFSHRCNLLLGTDNDFIDALSFHYAALLLSFLSLMDVWPPSFNFSLLLLLFGNNLPGASCNMKFK